MELSFGEQIKILLSRKNMTIKDLADLYTARTGFPMSRQNLTQRLKRDNFPEQDMRTIAALLGYNVSVQLTPASAPAQNLSGAETATPFSRTPDTYDLRVSDTVTPDPADKLSSENPARQTEISSSQEKPPVAVGIDNGITFQIPPAFRKNKPQGDINPLTGQEYLTNTVRRHPSIDEFVQVYDQTTHSWSDVREDYFWEFQEKKKKMMGADYKAPIQI